MATLFGRRKRKHATEALSPTQIDGKGESEPEKLAKQPRKPEAVAEIPSWASFHDLGLVEPLVQTCHQLGFKRPTPVQRAVIPFLLRKSHNETSNLLALASTGSGKTAAFCLPLIQQLVEDPFGIFAVVLTPTRELAKQIHQQVLALGTAFKVQSALVVGGLDAVRQACELDKRPHFCVATPGRLALLLRGPQPPRLQYARYIVLDEADRLLAAGSGFERDVAELLLHCSTLNGVRRDECQTLLFSATMTRSLESMEEMAGAGLGRLPLKKIVVEEGTGGSVKHPMNGETDNTLPMEVTTVTPPTSETNGIPKIPAGLKQEYIFMPSRVRDTYLLTTLRTLMENGGRTASADSKGSGWSVDSPMLDDEDGDGTRKARSAIVFVSTCERAAFVSELLSQVGVGNVALHSLLSQNRRLASLGKFKSQQVRVMVATDVASRGLDIPTVDLVVNAELPRSSICYVHRVGRTVCCWDGGV